MKRDFDLIRRILIDIQDMPAGTFCQVIAYPGEYDPATISEHVALLIDSALINGEMIKAFDSIDGFLITGLTWKGHDFIDAAKDNSIWNKAKQTVLKPTVSITFDLLLEWLKAQAKQILLLP
jgi:hypothetical protein